MRGGSGRKCAVFALFALWKVWWKGGMDGGGAIVWRMIRMDYYLRSFQTWLVVLMNWLVKAQVGKGRVFRETGWAGGEG